MRFLSVCSGIEAASVAWKPLGWSPYVLAEIESFPRELLMQRHRASDALLPVVAGRDWHPAPRREAGQGIAGTLDAGIGRRRGNGQQPSALVSHCLNGGVCDALRRLTPRECERLQGFPDDYTAITVRGKPAADGPRYRALGNSWAVPKMRYVGERIAEIERARRALEDAA